jgi:HK97 gp10 family phage protein
MPIVYNRIPEIASQADDLAEKILKKTAFDTEALAKAYAPVDTGNLMNSIAAEPVRKLTWRVTANAEYAIYVELGTRRQTAKPFLQLALGEAWPGAIRAFDRLTS